MATPEVDGLEKDVIEGIASFRRVAEEDITTNRELLEVLEPLDLPLLLYGLENLGYPLLIAQQLEATTTVGKLIQEIREKLDYRNPKPA